MPTAKDGDSSRRSQVHEADCLTWMQAQPDNCVDLILCSPPYEAARTYGIDFDLRGQAWVDWCVVRYLECVRICRGLVCWVVEGQTRKFRYSAAPALLMADLHRAGVHLRKPPVFHRVGIPGSGGPDWLRNDWEWCICAGPGGKLPWSDNTAMGHVPKWAPGGEMSYRQSDGSRRNQWGGTSNGNTDSATHVRNKHGVRQKRGRPSHVAVTVGSVREEAKVEAVRSGSIAGKLHTKCDGETMRTQAYTPPKLANPGNIIKCLVGGGLMGDARAHENEAPFPEALAEFFVRSFCPPDGIVADIFSGSGTTGAVAIRTGRRFIGIDIRASQVELTKRRLSEVPRELEGM